MPIIVLEKRPQEPRSTLNVDKVIVNASSVADARAICQSDPVGIGNAGTWEMATDTTVADIDPTVEFTGWRLHLTLQGVPTILDQIIESPADPATINDLLTATVDWLNNSHPLITGAMVTANTLTVAGAGDNLGAATLLARVYPPANRSTITGKASNAPVEVPGFITSIGHQGVVTDPLTVTFNFANQVPTIVTRAESKDNML